MLSIWDKWRIRLTGKIPPLTVFTNKKWFIPGLGNKLSTDITGKGSILDKNKIQHKIS